MARCIKTSPRETQTRTLLARVWERSAPLVQKRLDLLTTAGEALATGKLSETLRHQAVGEAHNLVGSLGMFGFDEGTDLARDIEHMLEGPQLTADQPLGSLVTKLRAALFTSA